MNFLSCLGTFRKFRTFGNRFWGENCFCSETAENTNVFVRAFKASLAYGNARFYKKEHRGTISDMLGITWGVAGVDVLGICLVFLSTGCCF